jgi:hypothetical protein
VGRARSKNPKKHQHCLRLTDRQEELLQRYAEFKGYETDMDAVRAMIDGLEDWFRRQEAKRSAAGGASVMRPSAPRADSGLVSATDVGASDVDDDAGPSVGDFAGRPSIGLPESRHDGFEG